MAMVSGVRSTLNPNAPPFIPMAVRQVEDFSPEWYELITTSTWFRDYWLNQQQQGDDGFYGDGEDGFCGNDVIELLPDSIDDEDFFNMEAQFEEFISETREGNRSPLSNKGMLQNGLAKDGEALIKNLSSPKGRGLKSPVEPPKYWEKPAKHISPRCSPRPIQQPR
ncbi:unnamed protein product [Ilex paraguariensis]|uniref:Uncharacterized protein n=1 Tax=Ilex paraguariensis TaxID=185542 RepID=A0ABC8UT79_9AQUA